MIGGGGGPTVAANFTGNASGMVGAAQQAAAALQRLQQVALQGGPALGTLNQQMQGLVTGINPAAAALASLTAQFNQLQAAQATLGAQQSSALFGMIASNANQAAGGMRGLTVATSGAVREFIVMGHEIMMGNWSRLGGSIPVLAERLGGLASIFQGISAPAIAAGVGVAALAAALGYVAYQAYEESSAITDTTSHLQLLGQGLEVSRAQVTQWSEEFRRRFNETGSTVKQITEYTDRMGPSATAQIPAIMALVEAWAAVRRENVTEALKEMEKTLGTSAESWVKGAAAINAISVEQEHYLEEAIKAKNETAGWAGAIEGLQGRLGREGDAVRENTQAVKAYGEAVAGLGEFAGIAGLAPGLAPPTAAMEHTQVQPTGMTSGESPESRRANEAAIANTKEIDRQRELTDSLTALQKHQAEVLSTLNNLNGQIVDKDQAAADINEELLRTTRAIANIQVELQKAGHGVADQAAFEAKIQQYDEEIKKAQGNKDEIARIEGEKAKAISNYYTSGSIEAQKAGDSATDATRAASNEQYKIYQDGIKRQQDEARHNIQEQIRLQQELISNMQGRTEEGQPFAKAHPEEYQSALTHLTQLQQQAADQSYEQFAAAEREKVSAARGNFDEISRIYQEWAARARAQFGPTSTQFEEVQREMVHAAQRASDEVIQLQLRAVNSQETADRAYLNAFKSRMDEMVRTHQITQQQALGFDISYTAQLYTQLSAQYQAILNNTNSTTAMKQEAYDKLLQLEADYTKQVVTDQDKIAEAAEKAAKKASQTFTNAFDQVGSSLEKTITDALTGQRSRESPLVGIFRSIVGGVVHTGGSLLSQGAGKLLAPTLGVSGTNAQGEQQGLGDVLGQALTKALGLGPKAGASETLQKSQADLAEVIKGSHTYVQENTKALNDLTQKLDHISSSPGGKASGMGGGSAGAGAGAGTGEVRFNVPANLDTNTAALKELTAILSDASKSLPPGYKVEATSTVRPGSTVAGTGGVSQHALGDAIDVRIVGPQGAIPSMGGDSTGIYSQYAVAAYRSQQQLYPNLSGQLASGTQFGKTDAGHFDLGGDRGSAGSLASLAASSPQTQQLNSQFQQLGQATQQQSTAVTATTQAQQQQQSAVTSNSSSQQQQTSAVTQDTSAIDTHSTATRTASSAVGGAGGGGLVGGVQSLTGQLSRVSPIMGVFSSTLGIAQSAVALFSTATSTAAASTAASSALKAIPLVGALFDAGGIVSASGGMVTPAVHPFHRSHLYIPSAAGGMSVNDGKGGTLAVVHPQEMVLPADISSGLQSMIKGNSSLSGGGGYGPGSQGTTQSGDTSLTTNHLTYSPQFNGNRFGSGFDSAEVEGMLRSHGSTFLNYASNAMRNGFRG